MRLSVLLVVAALVPVLFAGCGDDGDDGGSNGPGVPPLLDRFAAAQALLQGVPCEAPVGASTSDNLVVLGNASFEEGGVGDIDIRNRLMASTRSLHDITDPIHPVLLADFDQMELPGGGDVKFLSDNQTLVLGGDAVYLFDIRDPTNPVVEDDWQFSEFSGINLPGLDLFLNAHMLGTASIGGTDWVFVAPNSNSGIWVLRVDGAVGDRELVYVTQTLPIEGGPLGPHDMFIQKDNATEQWLLYSADGFHGWTVFNIDDPANPMIVGGFFAPRSGYTHTIQAAMLGERRIVATIQEVGANFFDVFDATNLAAPILLGSWQVAPAATTPQHNFNIVDGRVYMAHYGYGMYVFELQDAGSLPLLGTLSLKPVAHYDPVPGGEPYIAGIGGFEATYDVNLKDGILYVGGFSEPVNGIHVLGFGCIAPGDAEQTSLG